MVKSQLRRKQAVFINITLLQAIQSCILIAAFGFTSVSGHASERQDTFSQNTVTLQRLLEAASTNHPNLRAAQSFIQASQQDISSANRLRWPELSLVIESDQNKQPTSTPSRNARLQQTLWDFGRVSHLISESEVNSELAYIGKDLQELDLHLQIIKAWEDMLASNRRLTFARASLDTLNAFQAQMQRRVNAMASPSIDLELVESRLLQTQVEYNNAQSQLSHSLFVLEQLSGLSQLKHRLEAHAEPLPLARLKKLELEFQAADWPVLARSHPTVREAELEHQVALRQLDSQTAAQFPQIYLRIEKPLAKTQFNTNTVTN
jgi:outer membrane protein TolC